MGLCQGDRPIGKSEVLLQYSSLQGRDRRGGQRKEGEGNCKYRGVALEECISDLIEAHCCVSN